MTGIGLNRRLAAVLSLALMGLVCIGLSWWQLERSAWKNGLITRLEALSTGHPQRLANLSQPQEFQKVTGSCTSREGTRLYPGASAMEKMGYHVFSSCENGLVLNRGYIPFTETGFDQPLPGHVQFEGQVRFWPEMSPLDRWIGTRRPQASDFSGALPYFIQLNRPAFADDRALPVTLDPRHLQNNHKLYAIQWMSFAVIAFVIAVVIALGARRKQWTGPKTKTGADRGGDLS